VNIELNRLPRGCCPCLYPEFAVDVPQMRLDGALAQAEAIGNCLVTLALDDRLQDLGLPFGEWLSRRAARPFEGGTQAHDDPPGQGIVQLEAAGMRVLDAAGERDGIDILEHIARRAAGHHRDAVFLGLRYGEREDQ